MSASCANDGFSKEIEASMRQGSDIRPLIEGTTIFMATRWQLESSKSLDYFSLKRTTALTMFADEWSGQERGPEFRRTAIEMVMMVSRSATLQCKYTGQSGWVGVKWSGQGALRLGV